MENKISQACTEYAKIWLPICTWKIIQVLFLILFKNHLLRTFLKHIERVESTVFSDIALESNPFPVTYQFISPCMSLHTWCKAFCWLRLCGNLMQICLTFKQNIWSPLWGIWESSEENLSFQCLLHMGSFCYEF